MGEMDSFLGGREEGIYPLGFLPLSFLWEKENGRDPSG